MMNDPKTRKPPGRNDPCVCGSGKKYKNCHGANIISSADAAYARIRRLDDEAATLLRQFAMERYGKDALQDVWMDFFMSDEIPFDEDGPEGDSFVRWFLFNWKPDQKATLPSLLFAEQRARIDEDLRRFIERTAAAPYSFYQTTEVQPGASVRLRDILRGGEVNVTERSASRILLPGHILLAKVVEMDGIQFFMGTGGQVIYPRFLQLVMEVRTSLRNESLEKDGSLTDEFLREHEAILRGSYFRITDIETRPPDIHNTDGDPLILHTLTYEIPSLEHAFHRLKDLETRIAPRTDEEFFGEAEIDKSGKPKEIVLNWCEKGHKGVFGDTTTLATLKIRRRGLIVEANSERRAKRIQREIKKRLGGEAVLLRTEIQSHESLLKEVEKGKGKPISESEEEKKLKELPEVKAMMKQMMEKHMRSWPDEPVPALRGMTPRLAAKDPEGRELLESLLLDFEMKNETEDELLKVDTERLRRELGMEHK